MKSTEYSHARHTLNVMKGSRARCGARSVLSVMCMRAEFKKPEVTITKKQIGQLTGLERKAVQKALAFLRAEGCIVPVAHFEGGSGHAVTYRLEALGQGGQEADQTEGGAGRRAAIARILAEDKRLSYGEAVTIYEKSA